MKKLICVLLCASFLSNAFLFSADKVGKNDVKKNKDVRTENATDTKKSKKKTPPPPTPRHRNRRESVSETLIEAFAELFVDILVDVAIETNRLVVFDDYPYATSDYFIQYKDEELDVFPSKLNHFSVGVDAFYFPYVSTSVETLRFSGYGYKWIGPIIENTTYVGLNNRNPYIGNFKAGLELATFQTYIFSWSWNFEWVAYYGRYFTNGLNIGFLLKSYPFDPFVIEYRLNCSGCDGYYRSDTDEYRLDLNSSLESYLELGAMIDNSPWEFYVAWKYLYDAMAHINENGYGVGFKYHF